MPKGAKKRTWSWLLLAGLLAALFALGQAGAAEKAAVAKRAKVVYDRATDRVSVEAHKASLKRLLARIALKSGVEIDMDPAVEQPVSIALKDRPLEDGLKQIARVLDLNYAMVYHRDKGQDESATPTLIYMKIVPKVTGQDSRLEPVVALKHEAFIHSLSRARARKGRTPKSPTVLGHYAQKRWQARLDNMPEEESKKIEEAAKKMLEKFEAHMAEREKHKAEREKRKEEIRARRQAREQELKASNPERYELRQQRLEELRQKAMEELME